jgi:hypothetical protein
MGKCKMEKLIAGVLKYSESDDYDEACEEWEFMHLEMGSAPKCVCTTNIEKNFYLINPINSNVIILGSSCVKNFRNEEVRMLARRAENKLYGKLCSCGKTKIKENEYCRGCSKKVKFGKHKGKTMGYVYDNEKSYCAFVSEKFSYGDFYIYIRIRNQNEMA